MSQAPKSNNLGVLGKVSVNFRRIKKPIEQTNEGKDMKKDVRPMANNSGDGYAHRLTKT